MELRLLRYFIRAAELLNFTKAATSLYVSQPALSKQIQQLEQELGAELFVRRARSVGLTQSGEAFLAYARKAVRDLEEGTEEVSGNQGVLRGSLSIAAFSLFTSEVLLDSVTLFKERFPDVRVNLRSGVSDEIESAVANGGVDLGFASAPRNQDLSWNELFTHELVLFTPANHPITAKEKITDDDLR